LLRKMWKKCIALSLALLMISSLFSPTATIVAAEISDNEGIAGYVTVSVEKFTLGQGYIVEPVRVPIHQGDNAAKVITELLGEGHYRHSGDVDNSFYLSALYNPGAGDADLPSYILQAIGGKDQIGKRGDADWLGQFDYFSQSGWMFAVNHEFPNVGASDTFVEAGDVVRWQYTVYGYGEDLGAHGELIHPANKDALTRKVAEINSRADKQEILADNAVRLAYDNAYDVLTNMESSQSIVDTALSDLNNVLDQSEELNTAALEAAIEKAELNKASVKVSKDGADVDKADFWVTQVELDALVEVIVSAQQLIADLNATQKEVDAKVLALDQAQTIFNEVKKPGLWDEDTKPKFNTTFTVAPKTAKLEVYNVKGQLVDIGAGEVGTYNVYTASLPAGDYRYKGIDASGNSIGGGKLKITTKPDQKFDFRQLNLKASNSGWNVDVDYTVRIGQNSPNDTSLTLGAKTAADQYPVLVLAGNTYFYYFEPSKAREDGGYVALSNSVTITLAASAQNVSGEIPLAREILFTVPEEATLFVGRKLKHFVSFEKVEPLETISQGGKQVYRYKLMNNQDYNYRVSQKGKLTNTGVFKANAANASMEITEQQLNVLSPNSILNRGTYLEGNIYLNINEQNHLKLASPGDEFQLLSLRSWQALIEGINNYFFEPDFYYEIITGQDVIEIDEGAPGSYSTIRAKKNGTAIVKVTYDALKVNGSTYIKDANDAFSAIWPENVGLFVVTVGQDETGITTGIESNKERNQQANAGKTGNNVMNLQNGAFDADIDSVYYMNTEPGAIYTFTPSAGSKVSVLRPVIDHEAGTVSYGNGTFSTENVSSYSDGSFNILLTEGRNIVKVERNGVAEYQVMTARPLKVTIQNVTRAGEDVVPGDRVKVVIEGLSFPANKLSGIYNFNAQINFFAGSARTPIAGLARQYNITTQANILEFQVPSGLKGGYSLNEGHIKLGFFGSPIGDHRNIDPLVGANPNFTALAREGYYSIFPRIVIVKEADKTSLAPAVVEAKESLKSVSVSADGTDVHPSKYWVTEAVYSQYAQLIESAQSLIADENAGQDEVNAKVLALNQAQVEFNQARQLGLQEEYSATFTIAPTIETLELYNAKDQLVDISKAQVGTYNVYTASLPAGDYRYKGMDDSGNSIGEGKLTVTTEQDQKFNFRQLNLKASNAGWNVDVDYTVRIGQNNLNDTSLTLGKKTGAGEYPVLVLTDKTYFYNFEPSEARKERGYLALNGNLSVTLANWPQDVYVAIPFNGEIKFTVPAEATLFVGRKVKHFVSFEEMVPLSTTIQNGKRVYHFKLVDNQEYNYRVSQPGKLTNTGTFRAVEANVSMEITEEQLNVLKPGSILNRGTYLEGNIYLNINEQNYLKLAAPGDEFKLLTLRSWQALMDGLINYFFEPDFHYEIITGQDVIAIDEGEPGSYSTIRAIKNGTAIVKVTYDALKVNGSGYITEANNAFSAIWPENVGLFVVTVGQDKTGIKTGIESNKERNQKANEGKTGNDIMNLQNGVFDADIDSVYYMDTEPGATYTFTPSAGSKVSVLRPAINHAAGTVSYEDGTFSTENVSSHPNGSFSILLTEGRNIVKIERNGLAEYQVMTARPLRVTIKNLTTPEAKAGPGDQVKVIFEGLSFPANKLSGIYNFNAQLNFFAGSERTPIAGTVRQYNITTDANSLELRIPQDLKGSYSLEDGHIKLGFFGSPIGDHRNINPVVGANPNFTASSREGYYSIFPKIVIVVDKEPLKQAVAEAKKKLNSVSTSEDGTDIGTSFYWVTKAVHSQYAQLLEAAQALVADENATQDVVDAKALALDQASLSFENAKKRGLKKEAINVPEQLNKHLAYLVKTVNNPTFGTNDGEWSILSLARANYEVPEGYFAKYYNNAALAVQSVMKDGKLDVNKGTEHSRLILGLTAIGKEIHNLAGYDISAALADFNYVIKQGVNGPIFALIALDSYQYDVPVKTGVPNPTTREKLIDYIISKEVDGGGWSLSGAADPDMTGMAIQALAPYYSNKEEVKAAVDRALQWLSSVQNDFGGYSSGKVENVQSVAQVIVALTSLGIDPHMDKRFNKNGYSAVDNLLTYAAPTGGFVHPKGGAVNGMATDQATYALVAYARFLSKKTSLYDMADVIIEGIQNKTILLPGDGQTLDIPNDGNNYTIRVRKLDQDNQISISLPNGTPAKAYLDLPAKAELPNLSISRGGITVELPKGIKLDGASNQNLELITSKNKADGTLKNRLSSLIASNKQLDEVHEFFTIGGDESIHFTNGFVAITFKGMKGKEAAFIQNGQLAAIQKFASDQEGLASGKHEYAYEAGNDLIVKTDHFTDFIVYSVKDKTDNGGNQPGGEPKLTIQLSIDKLTINKGYVLSQTTVEFTPGETVWDVLRRELDKRSIAYEYSFTDEYNSVYIESIAGDGEFDHGDGSGWMYNVNGTYPGYGATLYKLKQGDSVQWRYTTNLGADLGHEVPKDTDGSDPDKESPTDTGSNNGGKNPTSNTGGNDQGSNNSGKMTLEEFYKDSTGVSSWAYDFVLEATEKGFVQGANGKLNPKNKITRAEFAKLIVEVFNIQADGKTVDLFRDVQTTDWFYAYVNAAAAAGIVKGYNNQFLPNDIITREEMAVMIARAMKRDPLQANVVYQDRDQISSWAQVHVADISALNIMTGYADRFNPKDTVTREMAFVVMMRAHKYSAKAS